MVLSPGAILGGKGKSSHKVGNWEVHIVQSCKKRMAPRNGGITQDQADQEQFWVVKEEQL